MGKDLIAEKIIQDLEVFCVNQLCEWKDKFENLNKHAKSCPYSKTPEWLKAQSSVKFDDNQAPVGDMYLEAVFYTTEKLLANMMEFRMRNT